MSEGGARLLGVQFESELGQIVGDFGEESLRRLLIREEDQAIISIAGEGEPSLGEPAIELMENNIGQ